MSSADATIKTVLLGEDKSASSALKGAGDQAQKTEGHFHSLGKIAAGVFAGGALFEGAEKGIDFLKESAKAAAEEQQQSAVLARQMKNTAGATDEQVESTENWLKASSEATGITRDQLVPAFTNLMNATGSVTKSHKLLNLAMNVSAGTGKSLGTIVGGLQRAYNGSVSGLSRLGIATKDAEGNTLTFAQVQKEMTSHFKGDAASAASTAAGQYKRLGVMFEDLKISVGNKLLPILTKMGDWFFKKGIPAIQQTARFLSGQLHQGFNALKPVIDKVRTGLEKLTPIFDKVGEFIRKNPGTVKVFTGALLALAVAVGLVSAAMVVLDAVMDANPIMIAVVALAALAAGFYYAYTHSQKFRAVVQATMAATKAVITAFVHVAVALWHTFGGTITSVAKAAWNAVKGVIQGDLRVIQGIIKVVTSAIHGNWAGVWQGLKMIVSGAFHAITSIVQGQIKILLGIIGDLPAKIKTGLGDLKTLLTTAGKAVIQGLIDGIGSMIATLKSKLDSVTKFIKDHKGPIDKDRVLLTPAGVAIMEGLVKGIESGKAPLQKVLDAVTGAVKAAGDKMKSDIQARNSFASGFSSFATSIFGMDSGTDADGNPLPTTVSSILAAQKAQAASAHTVKTDVRALIRKGLSKSLIKQLQASGSSGMAQLQALQGASHAQIAALNKANARTGSDLNSAGMSAANAIYSKQIDQDRKHYHEEQKVLTEIRDLIKGDKGEIHIHLEGETLIESIRKHKRKKGQKSAV